MVLLDIGEAALHQPVDDLAHLVEMLGRARLDVRPQAAERVDVLVELPLGLLGHLADRVVDRHAG